MSTRPRAASVAERPSRRGQTVLEEVRRRNRAELEATPNVSFAESYSAIIFLFGYFNF